MELFSAKACSTNSALDQSFDSSSMHVPPSGKTLMATHRPRTPSKPLDFGGLITGGVVGRIRPRTVHFTGATTANAFALEITDARSRGARDGLCR